MFVIFIELIIFFLGLLLLVISILKESKKREKPNKTSAGSFCILIPARDESKVIGELLESIKKQNFNMEDVYVIVEDRLDKTFEITKSYNSNIVIRKHLELKRKGYALDEGIKYILGKNKHYDAYFIMDADNVLDKNFFKEMSKSYQEGYDIVTGYRKIKNPNNVIATSAGLTFFMMNSLINKRRIKKNNNVIIMGTGFYIKGDLIEKFGGYPFHSLTEDYELTLYASLNNLNTYYNDKAIFYDEQPTDYKKTITQRSRWIRGYIESNKLYVKKLRKQSKIKSNSSGIQYSDSIGIAPYLFIVISIFITLISNLSLFMYNFIKNESCLKYLFIFLGVIVLVYLVLLIITIIIFKKEKENLNFDFKLKVKTILFHPIFLSTYVICFLKAIFNKNMGWEKIEHGN